MYYLINFYRRHRQPIDFITIITPQAQMAGRHSGHRAAGADDLEMCHFIGPLIGDEFLEFFFEHQTHQCKAARVITHIIEQITQRGHAQRHRYPINYFRTIFIGPLARAKPFVHMHNCAAAQLWLHVNQINPHQLS